jgi:anti-anti-sigma regulatory factor
LSEQKKKIIVPDACGDIYSFEKVIALQKELLALDEPELDFSQVSFVDPYAMLGVLLIARLVMKHKGSMLTVSGISPAVYAYLERMSFFAFNLFKLVENETKVKPLKRSGASKNLIEITEIPNRENESVQAISKVVALFRGRSEQVLKTKTDSMLVDSLITVISEICQNIFEHSGDSGFFAAQSYSRQGKSVVHLAVCDGGIGIEGSFAEHGKDSFGSGAALLLKTLTTPISSKRPFGYGLCRVNSLVEQLRGNLYLRSNASSVTVMNKGGRYSFTRDALPFLRGTQISFYIIL